MDLAFLGLGRMGFPMAGHLARAGHRVAVYNRSAEKRGAWLAAYPGVAFASAADAVAEAEIVFMCLTDAAASQAVLLASEPGMGGPLAAMRPGAILIDHSSSTPESARSLAASAAAYGVRFLDAPVTGGTSAAVEGTLGIMVGGDPVTFAEAAPSFAAYAAKAACLGPVGSGQLAKLVNVIAAVGMTQALAEGLAFAKRAGLDLERLIEVLMSGSTGSYLLERKGPAMAAGRHQPAGFTVDLVRKDIGQALAQASALHAALPVLALVDRRYAEIQARGGGAWDTSSLISLLE